TSTQACSSVSTAHLLRDRPNPPATDAGRDGHGDGDGEGRTVQRAARSLPALSSSGRGDRRAQRSRSSDRQGRAALVASGEADDRFTIAPPPAPLPYRPPAIGVSRA